MLIYLIDDDSEDHEIFDMALSEIGLITSLQCFDCGSKALDNLQSVDVFPDFVFLDINMPGMNGFECLKNLNKNGVADKSKIVIYSTSSNELDISKSKELGAFGYIVKPVSFNILVTSIKNMIQVEA